MKKFISLLLALILAFALVSCTPETPEDDNPVDKGNQEWGDGVDTPIVDI